ncbi:hypothetical protein JW935_21620 [candidate division KSB1 bacterium]|nr:hypothetical protein [candidate division KSB1 bacterium]
MKQKKKGYGLLMILTIIFTLGIISTLIPQATASKNCLLGYKAHCTFTPISTLFCIILAGAICKIRKTKFTVQEQNKL